VTLLIVAGLAGCTAKAEPSATSSPTGPCLVTEKTGTPRSNTLIDLTIETDGVADRLVFQLGAQAPDPTGSTFRLLAGQPPFVQGGSGEPIEVAGTHFVEFHLDGMLIADEIGGALYQGETSLKPDMVALRQLEMTEAFEGVYNFVIGYDGNGCVALIDDAVAKTLTITIGH
jgi:hypothetical protein